MFDIDLKKMHLKCKSCFKFKIKNSIIAQFYIPPILNLNNFNLRSLKVV